MRKREGRHLLLGFLLSLALAACAGKAVESPTPFELGEEVDPPIGCQEYRERGGEC